MYPYTRGIIYIYVYRHSFNSIDCASGPEYLYPCPSWCTLVYYHVHTYLYPYLICPCRLVLRFRLYPRQNANAIAFCFQRNEAISPPRPRDIIVLHAQYNCVFVQRQFNFYDGFFSQTFSILCTSGNPIVVRFLSRQSHKGWSVTFPLDNSIVFGCDLASTVPVSGCLLARAEYKTALLSNFT